MAICPAGHTSTAEDYCDVCGLPVESGARTAPSAAPVVPLPGAVCPHCGTNNAPDALFCEACGYDFTTGTMPRSATEASDPSPAASPVSSSDASWSTLPAPSSPAGPPDAHSGGSDVATPSAGDSPPQLAVTEAPGTDVLSEPPADAAGPVAQPASPPAPTPPSRRPLQARPSAVEWVAEIWIDPDWYATQGATDALPSPGLPDVVGLRASSALIGRTSRSRNIHPDIDCGLDSGVSRRHAQVSSDGSRWWIEDLESANGTFVGASAGPLPSTPIGRGRVEFAPDQRIYLGGWTRIVIRAATDDEKQAFNA